MTHRLITGTFDLEDLGEIEVKGKAEPVHAYRVIGLRAGPVGRRGLAAVGLSSPLVGRAEELEQAARHCSRSRKRAAAGWR